MPRLLIVTEDASTEGLAPRLERRGFDVETAAAAAALPAAGARRPDLLLLDLGLPDGAAWELLAALAAHDPNPKCALDHANPFELLAATILSAQCTDVRVNLVTPALFARYPAPADLADADHEKAGTLEKLVDGIRKQIAARSFGAALTTFQQVDEKVASIHDQFTAEKAEKSDAAAAASETAPTSARQAQQAEPTSTEHPPSKRREAAHKQLDSIESGLRQLAEQFGIRL